MSESELGNVFRQMYERVTSPIFGSWLIAFSAWNWQLFVYLADDTPAQFKIDSMREITTSSDFLIPILATFAYVFLYPSFRNYVSLFIHQRELDRQKAQFLQESKMQTDRNMEVLGADHALYRLKYDELKKEVDAARDRVTKISNHYNETVSYIATLEENQGTMDKFAKIWASNERGSSALAQKFEQCLLDAYQRFHEEINGEERGMLERIIND